MSRTKGQGIRPLPVVEIGTGGNMIIQGMEVIVVPLECMPIIGYEQIRKHRKHRINKKWLKRYGRRAIHDKSSAILFDTGNGKNVLLVTKEQYDLLKEEVK